MPREIANLPELFPQLWLSHIAVATGSRVAFIAGVTGLALPEMLIEIDLVVSLP